MYHKIFYDMYREDKRRQRPLLHKMPYMICECKESETLSLLDVQLPRHQSLQAMLFNMAVDYALEFKSIQHYYFAPFSIALTSHLEHRLCCRCVKLRWKLFSYVRCPNFRMLRSDKKFDAPVQARTWQT